MARILTGVALMAFLVSAGTVQALETRVDVRVRTKDAKFLGTSMGGALITIRNTDTGELLATGVTAGTTGNTATIMVNPHVRGGRVVGRTIRPVQGCSGYRCAHPN